ncbi:putative Acid phosphatase [Helianthus debilis subsp. tardiflorus]
MHPYRPPFGGPARPTNPNTTQPQTPYNLQDMDPSFLSYAAYLSGAPPFVPPTYSFGQAGGSQPSQPEPESEPDVEVVPESQPELVQDKSKRGRRSHKKKEKDEPRRAKTTIKWTKDEEYTLTRAWLDISEDEDTGKMVDPQPKYSAFREPTYGHATFEIKNRTTAYYAWHPNQDGYSVETDSVWFHNFYWKSSSVASI